MQVLTRLLCFIGITSLLKYLFKTIKTKEQDEEFSKREIYMMLGSNLYNNFQYEDAIKYYNKSHAIKQTDVCFFNRATCYIALQNYILAIDDITSAMALTPNQANFYFVRGHCYYDTECYCEAYDDWKIAAQLGCKKAKKGLIELAFNIKNQYNSTTELCHLSLVKYEATIYLN